MTELLHATGEHDLDLGCIDPRAADQLGVGLAEQVGRVRVLVVALLLVPAPDRRAHSLDDHDLAAISLLHLSCPPKVSSAAFVQRECARGTDSRHFRRAPAPQALLYRFAPE